QTIDTCISVKADAPWNSVEELFEYAKEHPGEIRVGNSGTGAVWHLHAMIIEKELGIEFTHVPYESGVDAHVAVAGGHIEVAIGGIPEALSLAEAGEIKVLAIGGANRAEQLPDVPTLTEEGYDLV